MKKYNIRNKGKSVRLTEINPTLFCWADDDRYSGSIGDSQTFIGDFPCFIGDLLIAASSSVSSEYKQFAQYDRRYVSLHSPLLATSLH